MSYDVSKSIIIVALDQKQNIHIFEYLSPCIELCKYTYVSKNYCSNQSTEYNIFEKGAIYRGPKLFKGVDHENQKVELRNFQMERGNKFWMLVLKFQLGKRGQGFPFRLLYYSILIKFEKNIILKIFGGVEFVLVFVKLSYTPNFMWKCLKSVRWGRWNVGGTGKYSLSLFIQLI